MQSIVTGQLYIELDFHPETQIRLKKLTQEYLEIPTIPSSTIEFSRLASSARKAFDEVHDFLDSKELNSAILNISSAMKSGDKLIMRIDQRIDPVTAKTEVFLDEFSSTLRSIRVLTEYLSRHPESLIMGKYKGRE